MDRDNGYRFVSVPVWIVARFATNEPTRVTNRQTDFILLVQCIFTGIQRSQITLIRHRGQQRMMAIYYA